MSKFFMYGSELQEIEQLMMLVPNFLLNILVDRYRWSGAVETACPDARYRYVLFA